MIPDPDFNIWEHSQTVRTLYALRAQNRAPEMDASAQAAEILAQQARPGETVLDAGCGSGYFWRSLERRALRLEYYGLDYSPSLIEIGRQRLGLPPGRLAAAAIENVTGGFLRRVFGRPRVDHSLLINTLTFCPDYRMVLDRLAAVTVQSLIIRDNFGPQTIIRWEEDGYLDQGYNHLKAYWNQWGRAEVASYLDDLGFKARFAADNRALGRVELVVGKPYHWQWLIAKRVKAAPAYGPS